MKKNYSNMGNENMIVGTTANLPQIEFQEKQPIKRRQIIRKSTISTGSENIGDDEEQIDQCSPASKFDIRFLATSIRASHIRQEFNSKLSKKSINLADTKEKKENVSEIDKNKIQRKIPPKIGSNLPQLKKELQKRPKEVQNQSHQGEKKIRKRISNFLECFVSPLTDMIILGQNFYKIRQQPIEPFYYFMKKIGQGSFGSVYKGKCIKSGQLRAIKILKKKIMNEKDEQALIAQINILKKMDHINIIKLYDVFYFKNFFYVVTEYCHGGNLLTALQKQQIKSQKQVMGIMKQILSAVSYMHKKDIAHRDLKLENIVLLKQIAKSSQKICIKLIDFGLAQTVSNHQKNKTGIVGTVSYMPPEIFAGHFSCKSDVWSSGIIMCMLLIGYNPFKRKKQSHTIYAIQNENLNVEQREWQRISSGVKKLLAQMLQKDPEKRISSEKILNQEWAKLYRVIEKKSSLSSQDDTSDVVINNFNTYHRGNNFICYVKNFLIARKLTQSLRQQMALIFEKIDSDSSGVIQKQQLIELYSLISGTTSTQMEKLIEKVDQNKSGKIDFQQFLVCMTDNEMMRNKGCISEAFEFFDQDHTGYIERKQLIDCLEGCQEQEIVKLIKEADFNGDGKISPQQFTNYLMSVEI